MSLRPMRCLSQTLKKREMTPEECVLWPLLECVYTPTLMPWRLTLLRDAWCRMLVRAGEPRLNVTVYLLSIPIPNSYFMVVLLVP